VLHLDMSFHTTYTPGELIQRIDGDVSHLANFLSRFAVRIAGGVLLLIGVLTVVSLDDWRLGLMMGAFAAVYALSHIKAQGIAVPFWHAEAEARSELSGFVGERLGAAREIRTNGAEAYVMRRFTAAIRRKFSTSFKAEMATDVGWSISNIVFGLGMAAALGLGAHLYRQGEVTLGGVYLLVHYLQMLRTPLNTIGSEIEDLQQARVSIERTRQLLECQTRLSDGGRRSVPEGALGIELIDVGYCLSACGASTEGHLFAA
jgi:ABC-type multidrug transport system fused ATPase/permease subunit